MTEGHCNEQRTANPSLQSQCRAATADHALAAGEQPSLARSHATAQRWQRAGDHLAHPGPPTGGRLASARDLAVRSVLASVPRPHGRCPSGRASSSQEPDGLCQWTAPGAHDLAGVCLRGIRREWRRSLFHAALPALDPALDRPKRRTPGQDQERRGRQ